MLFKKDFIVEKLSDRNISDVYTIFIKTFGKKLSETAFRKKYDTSWCGIKHVSYVALHNKNAIGFYGCLPALFYSGGEIFPAAQACDSITLEAYRGKGIHNELAQKTYEELKKNKAEFVFALHSEVTYQATKRLGWVPGKKMFRFLITCNSFPASKIASKLPLIKTQFQKHFYSTFKNNIIDRSLFTNPLNLEEGISYFYNEAYMEYKSFNLNYVLEINTCRFWVCLKSKMEIAAVHFNDKEALFRSIEYLSQTCKKAGIPEIIFHATEGTNLEKTLSEKFTKLPSWNIGYKDLGSNRSLENMNFNPGDLDTF